MDSSHKLIENNLDSASFDGNSDSDEYSPKSVTWYEKGLKTCSQKTSPHYKFISAAFILLFICTNLSWYWAYHSLYNYIPVTELARPTYCTDPHAQVLESLDSEAILVPFSHDWQGLVDIEESPGGYRYADEHWADWVPHKGGFIAVPYELQQSLKLDQRASPVNDNSSYSHYLIALYHQKHCLWQIRNTLYQLNGTLPDAEPLLWDHVLHCLESLRQVVECLSDPTLIPLGVEWPGIPNGQEHVCGNGPALKRWAKKFQHDAPVFTTDNIILPHTEEWLQRHHS